MTAQEMFEEMGYKRIDHSSTFIEYENKEWDMSINFITQPDKGNRVHCFALRNLYQDSGMLCYKEIKAIVKQIEELGWDE